MLDHPVNDRPPEHPSDGTSSNAPQVERIPPEGTAVTLPRPRSLWPRLLGGPCVGAAGVGRLRARMCENVAGNEGSMPDGREWTGRPATIFVFPKTAVQESGGVEA